MINNPKSQTQNQITHSPNLLTAEPKYETPDNTPDKYLQRKEDITQSKQSNLSRSTSAK